MVHNEISFVTTWKNGCQKIRRRKNEKIVQAKSFETVWAYGKKSEYISEMFCC